MARITTAEVPKEVLDCLFDDFHIWDKIRDGRLTSKSIGSTMSYTWPDATSLILKHFLPDGKHIATTHCVKDNDGNVLHWDAKDVRLRGLCLWRA